DTMETRSNGDGGEKLATPSPAETQSETGGTASEERREEGRNGKLKQSKPKILHGRRRRGQDSDESAYSGSSSASDETESEEIYSEEDEDDESGEEYEDDDEEWDERT